MGVRRETSREFRSYCCRRLMWRCVSLFFQPTWIVVVNSVHYVVGHCFALPWVQSNGVVQLACGQAVCNGLQRAHGPLASCATATPDVYSRCVTAQTSVDKGATPYLLACASGAPLPMLSLLERHGANVLATDSSGATALILAAYKVPRTPLTTAVLLMLCCIDSSGRAEKNSLCRIPPHACAGQLADGEASIEPTRPCGQGGRRQAAAARANTQGRDGAHGGSQVGWPGACGGGGGATEGGR
jgi:hypothetical protein